MNKQVVTNNVSNFILNNWFKLIIIGAGVYIIFQKDMSFTVNFNAPFQEKTEQKQESPAIVKGEKERYSVDAQKLVARSGGLEKFEIPLFTSKTAKIDHLKELDKVSENVQVAYLKRFAHVAISERKKYGIPSSIILANALLHSYAGSDAAAKSSNNHFGLKENGELAQFENAWSGFRAHSQYITTGEFIELRKLSKDDYQAWARGLQSLGYSDDKDLAENLLTIIDKFQLYDLDDK
jgi:flagellum-specific peptidoglycan hydrolase FlgJ